MMCLFPFIFTVITADVTKYTAIETCPTHCIMADGTEPIKDYSIACPRSIPLGTYVWIDGTRYKCSDRYNKRLSTRFDIFAGYTMDDYYSALQWGKQKKVILIEL